MVLLPTAPLVIQPGENEGYRKEDEFGVVSVSLMQGDSAAEAERGKIWAFQRQEEENYIGKLY